MEVERIDDHLLGAELEMLAAGACAQSAERCANRALNLERLRAYRAKGQFPKNRDFSDRRVPYFRDAEGTLCAMAWLLWESGEHRLVEHVVATRNNATVHQLANEPGLGAWLDRNGLSLGEAARIQPSYDPYALTMVTPSYDVRVGSCSPVVTVEARHRGSMQPANTEGRVDTSSSVEFYGDVNCTRTIRPDAGSRRAATFAVSDGGGSFYFRSADVGTIELLLVVGGVSASATYQQHHVFWVDGGYRVPALGESLPASKGGCSAAPGAPLVFLSLLSWRVRTRRSPK